ncbi:unnamed protein product [Mytilus coruscus]|uniref:Chromo domain-containing protein n=1 Tax=Mytilus coruscus TaxID=42192 RepID=A0A6J8BJF7_MYTCO|nr:unnamed protein product [Mytilus coruscus]
MDPTKILAKFKGDFTENPSRWWKLFENFVNLYWDESKFCNAFPLFLEENAQIWFNGLPEDVTDTRENLKCEFLKKYQISHGQNFQKLSDFIDLKQQETESVAEYINRVNALSEDQDVGQFKLTKLQYKCKPELVRLMSLGKWPETVEEAEVRLRSVEANFHYLEKCEKKETEDKIISELKPQIDMMFQQISAVNSKSLQQPTASPPMVEPLLDDRKAKVQHRTRTPRRQRRRNPCYRCGKFSEIIENSISSEINRNTIEINTIDKGTQNKNNEAKYIEIAKSLNFDFSNSDLTPEQKQKLMVMLGTNRDVFAINLSELGCTDLHPHRIDTGDAAPVRQRFYRQSPAMKTESSKHIKEMLDNNIIEPSQSEWASPVCLVRKKGSTSSSSASNQPQYRFCIDFRQLNLLCVKRVYPIVQMDDIVDMLGEAKAKFYSTVDMFNGYHQIKLDPETKHKTAFTCHEGVFEFNRLPFGLSNSPHTFQLVMSKPYVPENQVQRHTIDDRNNDDSDLYLVERIVKAKRINNQMHYYIKWLGFGNRSNSWEPEENIPPELRHEFKVRMDQTKRIKAPNSQRGTRPSIAASKRVKVKINVNIVPVKVSIDVSIAPVGQQCEHEIQPVCDAQLPSIPEARGCQRTCKCIWKGSDPSDPRDMDVMLKNIDDEKFGIQATD